MKRIALGLLLAIMSVASSAQKQYFIYLQSEPEQPFFLKMNEKIHSSTSAGYIILSKLTDSVYNFTIGFPQNKWPEQKFSIDVKGKDQGYLLKNFGDKGWGLFDLETSGIQMGVGAASNASQKMEPREVSAFTEVLSKAANDPSLKERPVVAEPAVVKEIKKPDADQPVAMNKEETPVAEKGDVAKEQKQDINNAKKEDPAVVNKVEPVVIPKVDSPSTTKSEEPPVVRNDEPKPGLVKEPAVDSPAQEIKTAPVEEYRRSVVTKKSESSMSEGMGLSFIDDYGNGKKDTVSIFIQNPRTKLAETKEPVKEEKKFLDINNNDTEKKSEPEQKPTAKVPAATAKGNCASIAVEADFLKLRKKMAAQTTDDGMVDEGRKYFKLKCFTTVQLKNLSTLFLTDDGKYKFFDAAYNYVSDRDNFPSLEAELKDQYYINRFKAMLR
jgi:hypothetical protein